MNKKECQETVAVLMSHGKGLLAADESIGTATKRLESIGVESTEETRRAYRDLFLATSGIEQYLSGVILHEETLYQQSLEGVDFVELLVSKGVVPGVKVDNSTVPLTHFPNEVVTEGLDGLAERLVRYRERGTCFTKWRAVLRIGENLPSPEAVHINAVILARYASLVQEAGMVPIIEPEVLYEGDHSLEIAERVTTHVVSETMYQLKRYRVDPHTVILKTSMVLAGRAHERQSTPREVAEATARCLQQTVPDDLGGVVFLSGGQTAHQARDNLNAIARIGGFPWNITFSYARALQGLPLDMWQGKQENLEAARDVFLRWLRDDAAAEHGAFGGSYPINM